MHYCQMILDFQFGSTGKGLLAGYLAKRADFDTVVCAFATNAGHTYIDRARQLRMMTQQLPTGISSPTAKYVLLGPGSLINARTLLDELASYSQHMVGKRLMIHPHAAVVEAYHAGMEREGGYLSIGSTAKGVGEAAIERIKRCTDYPNTAAVRFKGTALEQYVVTAQEYDECINASDRLLVEGAQGFGLSMYHGFYPYTTSRDVTPWQLAADCGLPFRFANYIQICGTLRTLPIRVNNREGSSGPGYDDQREMSWEEVGVAPELTTVTQLPRRIFQFSQKQLDHALLHCGHYWETRLFLNFANYLIPEAVEELINKIEEPREDRFNPPTVSWVGYGPDDEDVRIRESKGMKW